MRPNSLSFIALIILTLAVMAFAQETSIQLPTNDNSSSFNITKNNGSSVFKVDGSGRMTGDGSGLSNVKPLAATVGGNQMCQITKNCGWYQDVRSVSLTVPASGICFVMASGYVRWESKGWDVLCAGILRSADPNDSWGAESEWYMYLNILTDYNCSDSSDQYTSFAQHRCFNVAAGTHTFTLWANKYSTDAKVRVDDVNLSVIYIPTGGAPTKGASSDFTASAMPQSELPGDSRDNLERMKHDLQETIDGTIRGRRSYEPLEPIKQGIDPQQRIRNLENEVDELKRNLSLLLQKVESEE